MTLGLHALSKIEQAPAQFFERDHDVLPERFALLQRPIPAFHRGKRRPLDFQFVISVQRRAGSNIGKRQRIAEQEGILLEQSLQLLEMPGATGQ
jgi:hypothetical protein